MEKEQKAVEVDGVQVAVYSWETLVSLLADQFNPDKETK